MMVPFFPFRKIRRNGRRLLIVAVFVVVTIAAYLEFAAPGVWIGTGEKHDSHQKVQDLCLNQAVKSDLKREVNTHPQYLRRDHVSEDHGADTTWTSKNIFQPWKSEYKGQVNLHVFEDWCGSSIAKLRANLHYPLYAHSRSTLKKLAVSPRWTNYGLRIFGYIHPSADGEFLFAVASDDNCEFWLSMDESPDNLHICAYVGKSGKEWTAPGEYMKYVSQISQPVLLQQQKRYYFELVHKQNAEGTDHVEVAWRLNKAGTKFEIIDSESLSLYTNESLFKMSDVSHIPQTTASHVAGPQTSGRHSGHAADMLREDPRDTFYQLPLLDSSYLQGVLPECIYNPSYIIKGFPLLRYQGLQFVRLTYTYPNDFTRLTHMENDNKCFYQMRGVYMERYGFSRYMILDEPEQKGVALRYGDTDRLTWKKQVWQDYDRMQQDGEEAAIGAGDELRYEENYDYLLQDPRRLLSFTLAKGRRSNRRERSELTQLAGPELEIKPLRTRAETLAGRPREGAGALGRLNEETVDPADLSHFTNSKIRGDPWKKDKVNGLPVLSDSQRKPIEEDTRDTQDTSTLAPADSSKNGSENGLNYELDLKGHKGKAARGVPSAREAILGGTKPVGPAKGGASEHNVRKDRVAKSDKDSAVVLEAPKHNGGINHEGSPVPEIQQEREMDNNIYGRKWGLGQEKIEDNTVDQWELYDSEAEDDSWIAFDPEVNWAQTFKVNQHNFQTLRSDWIELNCNVSGNLLIEETEALAVVEAFMEKLNKKYPNKFSLQRIVNMEKRSDITRGSRYLLELDLLYRQHRRLRLAHYIYELDKDFAHRQGLPGDKISPRGLPLLCNPRGFRWNPRATVYFIVPVKNQARWVQQFIVDMEEIHRATGDENFSIIITDFSSTDMDIEQALRNSHLPKYQYVRLNGNFQRSAGLQAGINLITDKHSILFLCDLHIHFPLGFIDSVRRHCVEKRMAFAPIVMRLNCGATPQEPDGYWEVNGFGLLGIYKSDLDSIGGMNTRDFTDRWGGEDWELLDRILEAGLEVERIYMRNFFHHYHSRRGMWNRQTIRSM
ncbi:beta-1,4-N-acetylgalactosaminyltransferase 3 [Brachyhypopomus gauderio]|uniref:beta-1,4-N-acetylgalactosaminyltransferase 3 n=1 Tax=Brachyhypopomus gauderio TaxID=698409 RepID=UPI0040427FAD